MANTKEVVLNRAVSETGQLGSFGFSIMGGAKAKIPCVVCNIEPRGPADASNKISIGDQLVKLNGEDLTELISKELVSRIRCAPSPSYFVFLEDERLHERVHLILQRQEEKRRKEKLPSTTSESSMKSYSPDRSPSHVPSRKPGHPSTLPNKEIEIETSVNQGQAGVVRVIGGKIVSQANDLVETTGSRSPHVAHPLSATTPTLEQKSLKSSCSSNSLGGIAEEEVLQSSEVTGGGKVFVVKQNTFDNGDGSKVASEATIDSTNIRRVPSTTRNGGVRISLNEEIFINSINSSQQPQDQSMSSKTGDGSPTQASVLANKYGSKRSPAKMDPYSKAIFLARQLYMLDGFKKSEVAAKLSDQSEFGQMVAHEYLKMFEFEGLELDECLRIFLMSFILTGETHDRERIMVHFSHRYFESNPYSFPSYDAVHGITCALLLLNSDLHTDHGGDKMSFSQFVFSLERIGVRLPKDKTKRMFDSIKRKPLESGQDDFVDSNSEEREDETRVYHVVIPGTFVEVELPETAPLFKEGYVMRKNIMDAPNKKVNRGKRQWKSYYAYLKGFLLYFIPPNGSLQYTDTSNALVITHCLAMTAADYHKKSSVIRVTTSDWHVFLLQANDFADSQQWITSINKAAALYSAPPLAAPIGSSHVFQRPTFPLAPTKNTQEQQMESHELRAKSIQKELEEHQAYKKTAAKNKVSATWFEKLEFLQFEFNRFHIYLGSLHSDAIIEFQGPLPTGLVPSPSISTLATSGVGDEYMDRKKSRDHSPLPNFTDSPINGRRKTETRHR